MDEHTTTSTISHPPTHAKYLPTTEQAVCTYIYMYIQHWKQEARDFPGNNYHYRDQWPIQRMSFLLLSACSQEEETSYYLTTGPKVALINTGTVSLK